MDQPKDVQRTAEQPPHQPTMNYAEQEQHGRNLIPSEPKPAAQENMYIFMIQQLYFVTYLLTVRILLNIQMKTQTIQYLTIRNSIHVNMSLDYLIFLFIKRFHINDTYEVSSKYEQLHPGMRATSLSHRTPCH